VTVTGGATTSGHAIVDTACGPVATRAVWFCAPAGHLPASLGLLTIRLGGGAVSGLDPLKVDRDAIGRQ
jgi:hypothetical protein